MKQLLNWILKARTIEVLNNTRFVDLTEYKNFAFWGILRNRMIYDIQTAINTKKQLYPAYSIQKLIGRFSYLFVAYFLAIAIISKIISFTSRSKEKETKYTLLATTDFNSMRQVINPISKKPEFGHSIFHPIFQKISQTLPTFQILSSYPFGFTLKRNLKLAINLSRSEVVGNFTPLESYTSIGSIIEIIHAKRHFGRMLQRLKAKGIQSNQLTINRLNLLKALPHYFEYYFQTFLPLAALNLDLCQRALKKESPDIVLLVDEYLLFGRSLLFAAGEKQIPSFAIQHGVISKLHPGYIYTHDEVAKDGNPFFPNSPLPTKTALYGRYYEQILTQFSAYPKSKLVVTGQPRYDVLQFANKIYDRTKFCQRNKLDPSHKIALILTQPFPVKTARTEFVAPTSKALAQIPNLQIVVKPHPNETSTWYMDLLREQGVDSTVLSPKSDTIESLVACDFVIAVNSTTIIEALILNKPVVVVNLSNFPEVLPWVSDGAVIEVTNPNDLLDTFQMVLEDTKFLQKHRKGRKKFLVDQIFKNDGKATDRVIAVIESLVRLNTLDSIS